MHLARYAPRPRGIVNSRLHNTWIANATAITGSDADSVRKPAAGVWRSGSSSAMRRSSSASKIAARSRSVRPRDGVRHPVRRCYRGW